jgi:hypothetical protein
MAIIRLHDHSLRDWCHVCGYRSNTNADVWYPENAEHEKDRIGTKKYVRICLECAEEIVKVAKTAPPLPPDEPTGQLWPTVPT